MQWEPTLAGRGGVSLSRRSWMIGVPRAACILVHGSGEHCRRYDRLARFLAEGGLRVEAYDLRGHGHSGGERGHIWSFQDYLADLDMVWAAVRSTWPGLPMFLYGHGCGGLIAVHWASRRWREPRGLVLSSPWLRPARKASWFRSCLAGALDRACPRLPTARGPDPRHLSRDEAVVKGYREDPKVVRRLSARWLGESMRAMAGAAAVAHSLHMPCLLVQGDADRVADPAAGVGFVQALPSADRTVKLYRGGYHELHSDSGWEQVLTDIRAWLSERA